MSADKKVEKNSLLMAMVSSRSTCVDVRAGALLVSGDKMIGSGYNGPASCLENCYEVGCNKRKSQRAFSAKLNSGFCNGNHAEINAMSYRTMQIGGIENNLHLYSTIFPCNECAKRVVGEGISQVYYLAEYDSSETDITKRIFDDSNVQYEKVSLDVNEILQRTQAYFKSREEFVRGSLQKSFLSYELNQSSLNTLRPSWEEYFSSLAIVNSFYSDNQKSKNATVLSSKKNRLISLGDNSVLNNIGLNSISRAMGNRLSSEDFSIYTTQFPKTSTVKEIISYSDSIDRFTFTDGMSKEGNVDRSLYLFSRANIPVKFLDINEKRFLENLFSLNRNYRKFDIWTQSQKDKVAKRISELAKNIS